MTSAHLFLAQEELADIGSIYKVQVTGPHSELRQPWHLDSLRMEHTGTREEMHFAFDCWFNPAEDKCVELPALRADLEPLPGKLRLFGVLFFFVTGVRICHWNISITLLGLKYCVRVFRNKYDGFAHAFIRKESWEKKKSRLLSR